MTETDSAALKLQLDGVSEPLVQALIASGVVSLTPVQLATLPHCLAGNDVLAKAKTGTGKTLAFLIPTVERVLKSGPPQLVNGRDPIRALVLSSTRELANQIVAQAERLLALVPGFNIECVLGGSSIIPQRERLDPDCVGQFRYGGAVDLMVATPGRLIEHMDSTNGIEDRLRGVSTLVLDEADQLLDGGFQRAIERIIAALPAAGRQTLCFSATVPDRLAGVLRGALRADHAVVDCVGEDAAETHAAIDQTVVVHSLEQSMLALYLSLRDELAARPDDHKVLVFLPTARQTQFTAAVLAEVGVEVLEIHSRRSQGERTAASDAFRAAARAVMLTSDVSARGVDYPDVTLVLQVGAPGTREQYVQRLGRTGRAGRGGAGRLLLCDFERAFLLHLRDLPVRAATLPLEESGEAAAQLRAAAGRVDEELAAQTYRAWLVMGNGQRKALKWTRQELVTNAGLFARAVLGRAEAPPVARDIITTMGLLGLEGLTVVDKLPGAGSASPREGAAAEPEEEAEAEVVVRVDKKELGRALRRGASAVTEALEAMRGPDALALQAALEAGGGTAEVAGYPITAAMVTIGPRPTRSRPPTRTSSFASLSSGDCGGGLPRAGSALSLDCASDAAGGSLPRAGSSLSLCSSASGGGRDSPIPAGPRPDIAEALAAAQERLAAAGAAVSAATRAAKEPGGPGREGVAAAAAELAEAKAELKALQAEAKRPR